MLEKEITAHQIASMAQRAVLYEVTATPKPGLVDRIDSGAHKDMDFYTFMDSSVSLYKGFFDCAMVGLSFEGSDLTALLDQLRTPGKVSEANMFTATKNINTHKGIVFTLGISCAVVGVLKKNTADLLAQTQTSDMPPPIKMEDICEMVSKMTRHLIEKDFKDVHLKEEGTLTYGEQFFVHYGFSGIRGEVASGFKTIREMTFETLRDCSYVDTLSINDLLLELLFRLMQTTEDTNLVTRGGIDGLVYAKRQAREFIEAGGMKQLEALEKIEAMNLAFCDMRLSPGGSADLLAVSVFLAMNEGIL